MNWFFKTNIEKRMILLFSGDLFISIFVFLFVIYKMSGDKNIPVSNGDFFEVKIAVSTLSVLFFSFLTELYETKKPFIKKLIPPKSLFAVIFSFIFLSIIYYLLPYLAIDKRMLALALLIFFVFQSLWHILFSYLMKLPLFMRKTLIVGTGAKAQEIGTLLEHTSGNYLLKGYISTPFDPMVVPKTKVIGDSDYIVEKAALERIKTIVMAMTERRGNLPIGSLLRCKLMGINVIDLPTFYELLTGKLPVEDIDPSWLVHGNGFRITLFIKIIKRVSDLFFSIALLFLVFPLFPLIALLIKLNSPGPIFYKQLRVGEMEKNIMMYKFRTMRQDAEENSGAAWAAKNDPRATKAGAFLRKTRLDELPQLFNVLKGDMSFIGPRP